MLAKLARATPSREPTRSKTPTRGGVAGVRGDGYRLAVDRPAFGGELGRAPSPARARPRRGPRGRARCPRRRSRRSRGRGSCPGRAGRPSRSPCGRARRRRRSRRGRSGRRGSGRRRSRCRSSASRRCRPRGPRRRGARRGRRRWRRCRRRSAARSGSPTSSRIGRSSIGRLTAEIAMPRSWSIVAGMPRPTAATPGRASRASSISLTSSSISWSSFWSIELSRLSCRTSESASRTPTSIFVPPRSTPIASFSLITSSLSEIGGEYPLARHARERRRRRRQQPQGPALRAARLQGLPPAAGRLLAAAQARGAEPPRPARRLPEAASATATASASAAASRGPARAASGSSNGSGSPRSAGSRSASSPSPSPPSCRRSSSPAKPRTPCTAAPSCCPAPQTILVLGTDARPPDTKEPGAPHKEKCFEQQSHGDAPHDGCEAGEYRADTLMLIRAGGGSFRKLSIPRDAYAEIPGQSPQKINGAYSYGGAKLQIEAVEDFLGIHDRPRRDRRLHRLRRPDRRGRRRQGRRPGQALHRHRRRRRRRPGRLHAAARQGREHPRRRGSADLRPHPRTRANAPARARAPTRSATTTTSARRPSRR